MIIGVPKEIKENEYRVGVTPAGVKALRGAGNMVVVESGAGTGSALTDDEYAAAGAEIAISADEVWRKAQLIVKVKEPRPNEYKYFRDEQMIFTFFHLAADRALSDELIKKGVTAIAYETVELEDGSLPILAPMSEVAGRLAVLAGANALMKTYGGRGVLLSGVAGVESGTVAILGGGIVGLNAAHIAVGLGAEVFVLDTRIERLRLMDAVFGSRVKAIMSNSYNLEKVLGKCDLLIGAVHTPGAKAPKLVSYEMVARMKKGSVIADVSVDQGGCVETIKPTTHDKPIYYVSGVVHYGVPNIPGVVPRTSTFALTNATLPYVMAIAGSGIKESVATHSSLRKGINIYNGTVTHRAVAEAVGREFTPLVFK